MQRLAVGVAETTEDEVRGRAGAVGVAGVHEIVAGEEALDREAQPYEDEEERDEQAERSPRDAAVLPQHEPGQAARPPGPLARRRRFFSSQGRHAATPAFAFPTYDRGSALGASSGGTSGERRWARSSSSSEGSATSQCPATGPSVRSSAVS